MKTMETSTGYEDQQDRRNACISFILFIYPKRLPFQDVLSALSVKGKKYALAVSSSTCFLMAVLRTFRGNERTRLLFHLP
jgi:hypothetical protein